MTARCLLSIGLAALASAPPAWTPPRTPDGHPDLQAKDGTHKAVGRELTFADGRRLFLSESAADTPK